LINLDELDHDRISINDAINNFIKINEISYIERKYLIKIENHARWIFTTNHDESARIALSDNRILCCKTDNTTINDNNYIRSLKSWLEQDQNKVAFYRYLVKRDIDNKDWINDKPYTTFCKKIRSGNINTEILFIEHLSEKNNATKVYKAMELYTMYKDWTIENGYETYLNNINFGKTIKKYNGISKTKSHGINCYTIDHNIIKNIKSNEYTFNPSKLNTYTNMSYNYIYLLEMIDANALRTIYKIGKTERNAKKRVNDYTNCEKILVIIEVDDCNKNETIILKRFRNDNKIKPVWGHEYFICDDKNYIINKVLSSITL